LSLLTDGAALKAIVADRTGARATGLQLDVIQLDLLRSETGDASRNDVGVVVVLPIGSVEEQLQGLVVDRVHGPELDRLIFFRVVHLQHRLVVVAPRTGSLHFGERAWKIYVKNVQEVDEIFSQL